MFGYDRISILDPQNTGTVVDGDGVLHVDVVAAWGGMRAYPDLHPTHPLQVRDPSQLKAPSFLASLDGLPLTLGHPEVQHNGEDIPAMLDADGTGVPENGRALIPPDAVSIGSLYGPVRFTEVDGVDVPVKRARVNNAAVRDAILSKAIREFSLGFRYIPIFNKDGELFDGKLFDVWQVWDRSDPRVSPEAILKLGYAHDLDDATKIHMRLGGNHGAMVPRGRAGYEYGVLGLDSGRTNIPFYEGRTSPDENDGHVHTVLLYKYDNGRAGGHTGPGHDGHRHVVDIDFDAGMSFDGETSPRSGDGHTHQVAGRGMRGASLGTDARASAGGDSITDEVNGDGSDATMLGVRDDTPPPRLFKMIRNGDESGVSGTGHVLDGVIWGDGSTTVFWRTRCSGIGYYKTFDAFKGPHIDAHPENNTELIFADVPAFGHGSDAAPALATAPKDMKKRRLTFSGFNGLQNLNGKDGAVVHVGCDPIASWAVDMDEAQASEIGEHVAGLKNVIIVLQQRISALEELLASSQSAEEVAVEGMQKAEGQLEVMEAAKDAAIKSLAELKTKAAPAIKALRDELEKSAAKIAGVDTLPTELADATDADVKTWVYAKRRGVTVDSVDAARAAGAFEAWHEELASTDDNSDSDDDTSSVDGAMRDAFSKSTVPAGESTDSQPQGRSGGQSRLDSLQQGA